MIAITIGVFCAIIYQNYLIIDKILESWRRAISFPFLLKNCLAYSKYKVKIIRKFIQPEHNTLGLHTFLS